MLGRLLWAIYSDVVGRKMTFQTFSFLNILLYGSMPMWMKLAASTG